MKEKNISHLMCSLTRIKDYSLVFVSGSDSKICLQNQFTTNMNLLTRNHHILSAHCNSFGKVLSVLRLFRYQDGYIYIQKQRICDSQIIEFKKYTIFYNIQLMKLYNYSLFGISGLNARRILSVFFSNLPNACKSIVCINKMILLWFQDPEERFLLIAKERDFLNIKTNMFNTFCVIKDNTWYILDFFSGIPNLTKETIGKFLPQEINLDVLNGIDYNKGCYLGQEIISRIYFKNIKTRKLYTLVGISNITPNIFSVIEMYDGTLWKKVGFVFFILYIKDNFFSIQCIFSNKIFIKKFFRLSIDINSRFRLN